MEIDKNDENVSGEIPQRAVSLYGQSDGVEDFPVLKAFQQYIDAEQEKARKRMLTMGVFFAVILFAVVAVFMYMMHGINMRNQTLNDRLIQYAMDDARRNQQPAAQAPAAPSPQYEAALKTMTDTLATIQKSMTAQEAKSAAAQPTAADLERERKAREEADRIQRGKDQLEAEKKKLEAERERLRQMEIEQQRRRLYPDYYEKLDAQQSGRESPSRNRARMLTDDDIREIIREAYPENEARKAAPRTPAKEPEAQEKKNPAKEKPAAEDPDDDVIEYFKDDEYTIPVDVKGSPSKVKFTVPVG